MFTLVFLAIVWLPYLVAELVRARHARRTSADSSVGAQAEAVVSASRDTTCPVSSAWTALDDRQLTRLLMNSAPRTTNE